MNTCNYFCEMIHRGEILEKIIHEKKINKGWLAKQMNVHRNTISLWLKSANIPDWRLIEIGKVINYDFSEQIEALNKYILNDPKPYRTKRTVEDCEKELLDLHRKYSSLQEKYLELIENNNRNSSTGS